MWSMNFKTRISRLQEERLLISFFKALLTRQLILSHHQCLRMPSCTWLSSVRKIQVRNLTISSIFTRNFQLAWKFQTVLASHSRSVSIPLDFILTWRKRLNSFVIKLVPSRVLEGWTESSTSAKILYCLFHSNLEISICLSFNNSFQSSESLRANGMLLGIQLKKFGRPSSTRELSWQQKSLELTLTKFSWQFLFRRLSQLSTLMWSIPLIPQTQTTKRFTLSPVLVLVKLLCQICQDKLLPSAMTRSRRSLRS